MPPSVSLGVEPVDAGHLVSDAQLMLAAQRDSTGYGEPQAVFDQIERFGPCDSLPLDRGSPSDGWSPP